MKNIYYVIFMLCLATAQTKPMITCGSADSRENYYNLNYMPEDILKEIALQESGEFSLDDLKTAPYYKKCINFSKHITLGNDGIALLNTSKNPFNTIKTLSCVDKQLHETLTDLRNKSNPVPEEKALLKLHYFDKFTIILPYIKDEYTVHYKDAGYERYCSLEGYIIKTEKGCTRVFIDGVFYYNPNEQEKISLPKVIATLNDNKSLDNALYILEKFYEECFNKSNPKIQKYINALSYCNNLTERTRGDFEKTWNLKKGRAELEVNFRLYALSSQTNKANEYVIPYLLIKDLLTDAAE